MDWIRLTRPFTLLPPLLGMLSGAAAALGAGRSLVSGDRLLSNVLLGSLMAVLLNAASNVLNQVCDLELDRHNRPERPLPSGRIAPRAAFRFSLLLYLGAILLAFLVQPAGRPELGVIVVFTAFLTWAYSSPPLRLRRSWWLAPLVIAVPRGGLLKVAGWACLASVSSDLEPWLLALMFFLFILGAAPTKDFQDMEGDGRAGCSSLPLRFGPARAAWIMAPFYVVPWLLLIVFSRWAPGGKPLLTVDPLAAAWIGGILIVHGVLAAAFLIHATETKSRPGRGAWRNLYILMMEAQVGLAALYLCF